MTDQTQILTPLKGFRDILPDEAERRQAVISRIQQAFALHSFLLIETPTLERASTLTGKYGEEADTLLYLFEDHGKRNIGLRYDQTVPTARLIGANFSKLPMPFRRYQIQPVFRAEKPQKGRYREFLQCDADVFGSTEGLADAEILSVFWACYQTLGFTGDQVKIYVNHRTFLASIADTVGVPASKLKYLYTALDKLDKKSEAEVKQEMKDREIDESAITKLFDILEKTTEPEMLASIIKHAVALGVPSEVFVFQPSLVRGLDYYTGLIFEIKLNSGGSSLGAGGRYDKLISQLGGPDVSAVGFGIGFDRTLEAMKELNLLDTTHQERKVLVTVFDTEHSIFSAQLTARLRSAGIKSELYPDTSKQLAKQLKYANAKAFTDVIILGPEEAKDGLCVVKNLESGDQKQIPVDTVVEFLQQ